MELENLVCPKCGYIFGNMGYKVMVTRLSSWRLAQLRKEELVLKVVQDQNTNISFSIVENEEL